MIGIINYGAGNLNSVQKAFDFINKENMILTSVQDFKFVDRLVLPGVGSFGHAMKKIKEKGFYYPIKKWIELNQPFLGICLGMQLLFGSSEEYEGMEGLSFFKGTCQKFKKLKVPQIGWNNIRFDNEISLLQGIRNREFFYFNHSYYIVPEKSEVVMAISNYAVEYTSIAGKEKVYGVQFHPEKSGDAGIKLLKNWVEKC